MPHPPTRSLPLADAVAPLLGTHRFGRVFRSFSSVDSTNTVAASWASENGPEGAVVLAEYQTAGRGRHGRTWNAQGGQNLMFSTILRPALPPEHFGLITLAASVAVAEALEAFTAPLSPAIKWPNDVLLEGRKCCGMLLESTLYSPAKRKRPTVILGIGLNVNQVDFSPPLAEKATSLRLATGRLMPRPPLLAALLQRLELHYDTLTNEGGLPIRTAYEARLAGLGQPTMLRLTATDEQLHGTLLGITKTGALRLQTDTGLHTFHAGEITTAALPSGDFGF